MKKLVNILKVTVSLMVFGLIPLIVFILLTTRTSAILGLRTYVVQTGSMVPILRVGTMVITKPSKSYSVGDIITFHRGELSITHRIIGIKKGQFQTKGDANKVVDPKMVNLDNIIGKDILIVPYFGNVANFIKSIPGFILLIVIPTVIFVGYEVRDIKREWEKEIEEKVLFKLRGFERL